MFPTGAGKFEEFNFRATLSKYLRFWYLFMFGAVLCLGIAYVHLRYAIPQYYISSKLLIKDGTTESGVSGSKVFSDIEAFNSIKNIDNEIEILKSKSLMQRVLSELSLNISYYVKGNLNDVEIYGADVPVKIVVTKLDSVAVRSGSFILHLKKNNTFELEENEQISTYKYGQRISKPYGEFTIEAVSGDVAYLSNKPLIVSFNDLNILAKIYSQKLTITQPNKAASVVILGLTDAVPEKGKDIINKLVEVYNKEAVEDKNLLASTTLSFIDERLTFLTTELTDVEKNVERYKRMNEITDISSQARLYMEEASGYNKQLAELGVQIDVLESIEGYLNKQGSQYSLVPSSLTIQDPTLNKLIARFNELQLERERMLRTTQATNPLVQNMSDQLLSLRTSILENLRNIKSSLSISRKNLQSKSGQFGSRIQKVPAIERALQEISRQQGVKESLYLYLLQKREESALTLASSISTSRTIDAAEAGDFPISPKRTTTYLIALLIGLSVPFFGIYLMDLLNDKVLSKKEVQQLTATPILGEIPHSNLAEGLSITKEERSLVAEFFRLIRANLQFATVGKANKVLMVSSSMSGEGKTFFSLNLGASLALTGKSVVVVSFDLRKPKLMKSMGLSEKHGVTNYLVSADMPLDEVIVPAAAVPGLFLIGSGPVPPNPTELMMSTKVAELINSLKERFDYIIIDTAPIGMVADAYTLAHLIDSFIYLVRARYTQKVQLSIIDDIYQHSKFPYPMIVLNDVRRAPGLKYGYGYGDEYIEKKKKKALVPS